MASDILSQKVDILSQNRDNLSAPKIFFLWQWYQRVMAPRRSRPAGGVRRATSVAVVQRRKRQQKVSNLRLSPVVRKLVDRRINKGEETHFKTFTSGLINFDSAIGEADIKQLMPAISQGDTVQDRAGAKIKLVSMSIKGYLKFVPSGANDDDSYAVRHMVYSSKKYRTADQLGDLATRNDIANNLLKDGNDAVAFNGTWGKLHLPHNAAEITVHYDKIKYLKSNAVLAELAGQQVYTRTSVPIVIMPYTIRLKVKNKILKYAEPADTYPSNFYPVLSHGFINLNAPTSADTNTRVSDIYQVQVRFKDM